MVFKRPRNSRDDKSGRSSNRASGADDRPKRSSSSRGNSASGNDRPDFNKPDKKYKSDRPGERNHFLHPTANQGRPVIIHQALVAAPAKRNHFHHAANHIQAARQIMTTVRKEVLVASHQAENHLQGEKHPIQAG
jgi:hypothetical protein